MRATITLVKAYQVLGEKPDTGKDKLLMEAEIILRAKFTSETDLAAKDAQWYIKTLCRQKLLSGIRLILCETAFAKIPLPASLI